MNNELRIIISGGGTGGHIFPAVSIANAIKAYLRLRQKASTQEHRRTLQDMEEPAHGKEYHQKLQAYGGCGRRWLC